MLKHSDNLSSQAKLKYDLYKILRMSILLNQKEADRLTLDKFKEASLSIDRMLGEEYDEKIEDYFYETSSLDDECKRLKDLVIFINARIEKRKDLLEDYRSVTNKELNDLDYISRSGEVDLYEARLKLIKSYIDNTKLIKVNEKELEVLKEDLVREYDIKSANEIKNTKIENTLHNIFVNTLYEMETYSDLETDSIDSELEKIKREIKETKEQKDTFESAFANLKSSGISGELEIEYASYVENARRNYYYVKERELILKLYKVIEEKESEYANLFKKREEVKALLEERTELRKNLEIRDKDMLSKVYETLLEQAQEIEAEKENIENISILTERIKLKENRLDDLNREIKRPEVLSLLKEYKLIDIYSVDDEIDTNEELDEIIIDNEIESEIIKEEEKEIKLEEKEKNKKSALDLLNELLKDDSEEESNDEIMTLEEPPIEEEMSDDKEEHNVAKKSSKKQTKKSDKKPNKKENEEKEELEETEVIEEPKEKTYEPNQIKTSEMLLSMNYGLSRLKAISVMKRVADMLGVNAKKEVVTEVPKEEIFVPEPTVAVTTPEEPKNENDDLFWTTNEFVEMKEETGEPIVNNNDMFLNNNENMFMPNNNQNIFINEQIPVNNQNIFTNEQVPLNNEPMFMPNNNMNNNMDMFNNNININVNKEPVFDFKMPEINNEPIFNTSEPNVELVFPDPVMPNGGQDILPENKEDKFMWPENGQTFDINGIFPS